MITAVGPGGTATSGVTVPVSPVVTLNITLPLDGNTIYRPDVMVRGMIANAADNDVGVTINGIAALVSGNLFAANHVPLEESDFMTFYYGNKALCPALHPVRGETVIPYFLTGYEPLLTSAQSPREMPHTLIFSGKAG